MKFFHGRLVINPVVIPVVAVMAYINGVESVAAFCTALVLHETAHGIMASALGVSFRSIELMPFGCAAKMESFAAVSSGKEVAVAAAGPLMNAVAAAAMFALAKSGFSGDFSSAFERSNVMLGAINMLPALPLDGGRIAFTLMSFALPRDMSTNIGGATGVATGTAMIAAGIYFAVTSALNPTLFMMGGFLIYGAVRQLKSGTFSLMKSDTVKRTKIADGGVLYVKNIAVGGGRTVGETLSVFDSRKYNIVYVVDDENGKLRTFGESELLRCAVDSSSALKMSEISNDVDV